MKNMITMTAAMLPLMAHAEWFNFSAFTVATNGVEEIGESQFWMEIESDGSGTNVNISFLNLGERSSQIDEIYFDMPDPISPLPLTEIYDDSGDGVIFQMVDNPHTLTDNVPGWNEIDFSNDIVAAAQQAPPPHNGIDPDEYLVLQMGITKDVFLDYLYDRDLRVALHGISLDESDYPDGLTPSASYLNNLVPYTVPIPEPGTIVLMSFGAFGLIGLKRKLSI